MKKELEEEKKKCAEFLSQKKKFGYVSNPPKSRNSSNKENLPAKSEPIIQTESEKDELNKLRRQVSQLRSTLKKMEIQLKEEKTLAEKEISNLKSALSEEKKRRQGAQEEKVERNNRLLQDLLEKDEMIFKLQREL